jgi:hypothetical protein
MERTYGPSIDLSCKRNLIVKTLKECKDMDMDMDMQKDNCFDQSFTTHSNTSQPEDIMRMFSAPEEIPMAVVEKPRKAMDLEEGRKLPAAAGLEWTDGFFDGDTDDLVAVFDHDHKVGTKLNLSSCLCLRRSTGIDIFSLFSFLYSRFTGLV